MEFCNVAFLFFNNLMFQKQIQTGLAVRSRNRLFYILLIPLKNIIQVPVGFKVSLSTTKSICNIQRYFYTKILTIITILLNQCGSTTVLCTELGQKECKWNSATWQFFFCTVGPFWRRRGHNNKAFFYYRVLRYLFSWNWRHHGLNIYWSFLIFFSI